MMDEEPRRKRRDSLEDQLGAPLYTEEPTPPFTSVMRDLFFISYRCNPVAAQALLPEGLTLTDPPTVTLALYRHGIGWGIENATAGFFSLAVEEYMAPDTSQAAFFVFAVMQEPKCHVASQHYGTFRPGGADISEREGDLYGRLWDTELGDIVRVRLRPSGPLQPQAANDQYIGRTPQGDLRLSLISVVGPNRPCDIVEFEIGKGAPPEVRQLAPTELLFAIHDPELLFSWGIPKSISPSGREKLAGRSLLLDLLGRQKRALAIISPGGEVLEANEAARALLSGLAGSAGSRLGPPGKDQGRAFRQKLAELAKGTGAGATVQALLPRKGDAGPLVIQVLPADPALAGPDTLLALITDPASREIMKNATTFELLGLTPAEARVAAAVGSGLPPREAGIHLGLTESTMRSTLKIVFGKLGITRQAQLTSLTARLDTL